MRAIRILEDVSIEDFKEPNLSVDFAASHIGGGVLRGGCVQEEIMFLTHPEMLLSLLFWSRMQAHEAILITGAERTAQHTGYSNSFRFAGDYIDSRGLDAHNRMTHYATAIDAINYGNRQGDMASQFS
jgi:poly(ADP-ribose) glycohydrolase